MKSGENDVDNKVDLNAIYNSRANKREDNGMSFKDALWFLRHKGVGTNDGLFKIDKYAMIGSIIALKTAIVMNGPCVGGMPVYDSARNDFWFKDASFEGGHAISIVGYDKEGFIIRNSWGSIYGSKGYWTVPYDEFGEDFFEIWTLIR